MSKQNHYGYRAEVREHPLTDNSIVYQVAIYRAGKATIFIAARDEADAHARADAITFAFRDLD